MIISESTDKMCAFNMDLLSNEILYMAYLLTLHNYLNVKVWFLQQENISNLEAAAVTQ